jgi:general secretion pathway protein G
MTTHRTDRRGFTLIEIVIAVAIVAIFAAAISPMVFRHLEDAKIGRAQNECETIATAVLNYYKDVGTWPYTDQNGPRDNEVDRVVSSQDLVTRSGPDAGRSARRWGNYGSDKMLGDYLYYNNPDDDSGERGANQDGQDWPTSGRGAWKGPYVDSYEINDPWGNAYVINARFLPGGDYNGSTRHKVYVLSAGPNGTWETPFHDDVTAEIMGDDVGAVISIR